MSKPANAAAARAELAPRRERIQGLKDLAWWTGVCPSYAPFTLPRLARALRDPDPGVKGAAAMGLGSTGAYGRPALPDLLAARGLRRSSLTWSGGNGPDRDPRWATRRSRNDPCHSYNHGSRLTSLCQQATAESRCQHENATFP